MGWGNEEMGLGYIGLDYRFTDGGKVIIPTERPRSTHQKHYSSASGIHFC
jgi:hypothetical protein